MRTIFVTALSLAAAIPLQGAPLENPTTASVTPTSDTLAWNTAIDARSQLKPSAFKRTAEGQWESAWRQAEFAFDELIYYWNVLPERGEGFRLYLQVRFAGGSESPWLYAGYWGKVKPYPQGERQKPKFEQGSLEHDQLLLKEKALAWRFRVVSEGDRMLSERPLIGVITTDNHPSPELAAMWGSQPAATTPGKVLDVPLRNQEDVDGNPFPDRCQSAAVASAMQYFGTTVPLEQIIAFTTDPEYKSYGIWPRTINTAHEFGFEAYLDRFRNWDSVKRTVAENKIILCSITMPRNDTYIAPPYPSIGGHIVALCGVTDDGRVIVTDSAKKGGYLSQWKREDFEKIWMRNKGGVGMVIVPPKDAPMKVLEKVPPFPQRPPATESGDSSTSGTAPVDSVTTSSD